MLHVGIGWHGETNQLALVRTKLTAAVNEVSTNEFAVDAFGIFKLGEAHLNGLKWQGEQQKSEIRFIKVIRR